MNFKESLKNKKVRFGIGGAIVALIVVGGIVVYESNKITIEYTLNNKEVEYGIDQKAIDWDKVSTTNGNKITTSDFDTKKVGETEVIFTVCLDDTCKDFKQKLEIKDTKNPEIKLKSEKVELTEGDNFDPTSNIESVKDPVNGDIKKSEDSKITKSGYLINSDVNNKQAGEYTVKITAFDVNGNKAESSYKVTVKEKPEEPQPITSIPEQVQPQTNYATTPQPQGSATPSGNSGATTNDKPSTETCVANGQWKGLANDEHAFYSHEEAKAWAEENCDWDNYYYTIGTVQDICGNPGWSVSFFPYDD